MIEPKYALATLLHWIIDATVAFMWGYGWAMTDLVEHERRER